MENNQRLTAFGCRLVIRENCSFNLVFPYCFLFIYDGGVCHIYDQQRFATLLLCCVWYCSSLPKFSA